MRKGCAMASDDPLLAYMDLPLGDRRAVERLLPASKRRALQERLRQRLESERLQKQRARNPALLIGCSPLLSKHLLAVATEMPGAAQATEKARSAIRTVIEQRSAAP